MQKKSEPSEKLLRVGRFLHKPWDEKAKSIAFRWKSIKSEWTETLSRIPVPVRLPFGAWWVPRKDNLGELLLAGKFEKSEIGFVQRFLQPGMAVLDLGAHHGLYTLLASECVGSRGRVVSFEPSWRERRALRLHVLMNLCRNVTIEDVALGNENARTNLFVVEGSQTGCNSLRPPDAASATSPVPIRVRRLDDWLQSHKIDRVDFIKLDVEGAELDVLKGASRLLQRRPRPVILAEVQDVRTRPWGYRAKDIIEHLGKRGYKWFGFSAEGWAEELDLSPNDFEGNFVACPEESLGALQGCRRDVTSP
jgi:FkbM family methyltransferase